MSSSRSITGSQEGPTVNEPINMFHVVALHLDALSKGEKLGLKCRDPLSFNDCFGHVAC